MGRLILLDTSELLRPLPRKLHAAWAEIDGRKAAMPPTVGLELAPHGLLATTSDGMTTAERLLRRETPKLSKKRSFNWKSRRGGPMYGGTRSPRTSCSK